jgi:hypothetical protein
MSWVLLGVAGLLAVLVAALSLSLMRLNRRLVSLESRLAPGPSSDTNWSSEPSQNSHFASLDDPAAPREPQYVITQLGEEVAPEPEPVAGTVDAGRFADLLLRESVVQAASWASGLRRALSPEVRNRIRFEMRREVKRSRRQRKVDTKQAYREWTARQRAAMAAEDGQAA